MNGNIINFIIKYKKIHAFILGILMATLLFQLTGMDFLNTETIAKCINSEFQITLKNYKTVYFYLLLDNIKYSAIIMILSLVKYKEVSKCLIAFYCSFCSTILLVASVKTCITIKQVISAVFLYVPEYMLPLVYINVAERLELIIERHRVRNKVSDKIIIGMILSVACIVMGICGSVVQLLLASLAF